MYMINQPYVQHDTSSIDDIYISAKFNEEQIYKF